MPDAALVRFERVAEAVGASLGDGFADGLAARPDAARRLAALVGGSSSFADALIARPALATATFELPPAERPLFPGDPAAERLRVAAAYATRELTVPGLGRRLASVADGMLSRALERAAPVVPVAVVGLGRLGREELSFASDLDVLFVYEGEGSEAFAAAQDAAERVMTSAREWSWQVDANLRPEGRSGPAARSIVSYLEYWDRWAETWEFQALLGARPVAGDEVLALRFVANARDVAYPQVLTLEQVAAIRRMRVRMEEERVRADARRHHFKLGYGGLADVQFAVELSLMRFGFDHPEVRRTNTLDALEALAAARLIEASVGLSLAEAYVFLSEIKASMELERMLPAEALPPTPEGQAALARRLGYGERARQAFLQDYRRVTRRARVAMERVFYGEDV
jgi:glutamate-ammonia-ligase adenylyltransferase